ncbi:hypothetical protein, partial [Paraburkholderia caribensis]|uniref:hypothetical protein n=1 Tax=Paraburkholderia caribensis TaxID=75105 RepID=UPI0020911D1A
CRPRFRRKLHSLIAAISEALSIEIDCATDRAALRVQQWQTTRKAVPETRVDDADRESIA